MDPAPSHQNAHGVSNSGALFVFDVTHVSPSLLQTYLSCSNQHHLPHRYLIFVSQHGYGPSHRSTLLSHFQKRDSVSASTFRPRGWTLTALVTSEPCTKSTPNSQRSLSKMSSPTEPKTASLTISSQPRINNFNTSSSEEATLRTSRSSKPNKNPNKPLLQASPTILLF